jgi:hypothetical protein
MSERPFSDAAQKRLADPVINLVVRIVRGYWTLVASLACLESCVDDIMLHLIPRRVFREGASEDAWYAWDIVTKALNLKARTAAETLEIVPDAHLQYLFSPMEWKEHTLPALRRTKRDRRTRFV